MYHSKACWDTARMPEARERCGNAVAPGPRCREETLDLAEELFVSCRFTEASRVCNDALSSGSKTQSANGRALTSTSSSSSSDPGGSTIMVAFDDQFIAPVADCDTCDLFVAVLLQCGFELQRAEEWDRCRAFYSTNGDSMPFAVGILWLRLRLAGGEFELVRRVLWQLREALANELQHRTSLITTGDTRRTAALANYTEATEMLVLQVMLPCGECGQASALVSDDAYLAPKARGELLRACEASTLHSHGEDGLGPTADGSATRNTSGGATASDGGHPARARRRTVATGEPRHGYHTSAESFDPPPDDGAARFSQHQQGAVQKLLSSVSDWTPEARIQLVVGAGAAGLAAYATLRNRDSLWRAARNAAGVAVRTAGDIGGFIVGSS